MVKATVIEDSVSPTGDRLTTMEVTFWRPMLPELNTHRKMSRNSGSSRAIPLKKLNGTGSLDKVKAYPVFPLEWVAEQAGMSGGQPLMDWDLKEAQLLFFTAWNEVIEAIEIYLLRVQEHYPDLTPQELKAHMLHKSLINRLIEPFSEHTVILSSTEWDNFFQQRCHPDAQPEMRILAEAMRSARDASTPKLVGYGEYHLPYIRNDERKLWGILKLARISIARCARVSYLTHDGATDCNKDLELFQKLDGQNPKHYSPGEHVATPAKPKRWYTPWRKVPLGNFDGWNQARHNGKVFS